MCQLSRVDESESVNVPAEFALGKFREILLAGGGDDLISAGDRKVYLSAGGGNDDIEGGRRAQLLLGDDGDDRILDLNPLWRCSPASEID